MSLSLPRRVARSLRLRLGLSSGPRPGAVRALLRLMSRQSPAFAPTEVQVLRELPKERVLILAPHPDDEVIGMGGCLAHYLDNGSEVTVLYLTDGGGLQDDRQGLVRRRRKEAETVAERFPMRQIFWTRPDTRLAPDEAAAKDLRGVLEQCRPDTVYLPSFFEHHYDHYAANAVLHRALLSGKARGTVAGYEVWDNLPFPNLVVDVSAAIDRKQEMMELYKTPMATTDFVELIRHRAALHYLLLVDSRRRTPAGHAEAFYRLDARTFVNRFGEWDAILRARGSALTSHLDTLGTARFTPTPYGGECRHERR